MSLPSGSRITQTQLGDITYVELPEVGTEYEKGDDFGEIESNKSVSQLEREPISGEIVEINEDLDDNPEVINDDPYGEGWMVKIRLSVPDQLAELMKLGRIRRALRLRISATR